MEIKEIIEKAVGGGWIPRGMENTPELRTPDNIIVNYYHQPVYFLDPKFWQAVAKTEGWDKEGHPNPNALYSVHRNMHAMIDSLIEGNTIEEFIKTL